MDWTCTFIAFQLFDLILGNHTAGHHTHYMNGPQKASTVCPDESSVFIICVIRSYLRFLINGSISMRRFDILLNLFSHWFSLAPKKKKSNLYSDTTPKTESCPRVCVANELTNEATKNAREQYMFTFSIQFLQPIEIWYVFDTMKIGTHVYVLYRATWQELYANYIVQTRWSIIDVCVCVCVYAQCVHVCKAWWMRISEHVWFDDSSIRASVIRICCVCD